MNIHQARFLILNTNQRSSHVCVTVIECLLNLMTASSSDDEISSHIPTKGRTQRQVLDSARICAQPSALFLCCRFAANCTLYIHRYMLASLPDFTSRLWRTIPIFLLGYEMKSGGRPGNKTRCMPLPHSNYNGAEFDISHFYCTHHMLGIWWGETACNLLHGWLQCLHFCIWSDRLREDFHHGG